MRPALPQAQTLETLRMRQHLTPLLGQRGELPRDLLLSSHAYSQHLLGLLSGRHPTQGRQAQGDASRILRLAHPMVFGHPKERFDWSCTCPLRVNTLDSSIGRRRNKKA
jgi:hypothetical protein